MSVSGNRNRERIEQASAREAGEERWAQQVTQNMCLSITRLHPLSMYPRITQTSWFYAQTHVSLRMKPAPTDGHAGLYLLTEQGD